MNSTFLGCTGLILILSIFTNVNSKLYDVEFVSRFPVYEEEDFIFKFISDGEQLPNKDGIIFRMMDDSLLLQSIEINPGMLPTLISPITGFCFHVNSYDTDENYDISVVIRFFRKCQQKLFQIYYVPGDIVEGKDSVVQDLVRYQQYFMTEIRITLLIHWNLTLKLKTLDSQFQGLYNGEKGYILCKATGGFPFAKVRIIGLEYLHLIFAEYDNNSNTEIATVIGRIEDHGKKIGCAVDNDIILEEMHIFHRPTQLYFQPPIDNYVANGTNITCLSKNGFPKTTPKWRFEYGSILPGPYFDMDNKNGILHIKSSAPRNTKWKFSCSINNFVTDASNKVANEVIEFTIGDKPNILILLSSIFLSIIVMVFGIIIVFSIIRCKKKIRRYSPPSESKVVFSDTKYDAIKAPPYQIYEHPVAPQFFNQPTAPKYPVHEV